MTSYTVREESPMALAKGAVVWAPDDSDWLEVFSVHHEEDEDRVTVYRRDGSLADFKASGTVLVQA